MAVKLETPNVILLNQIVGLQYHYEIRFKLNTIQRNRRNKIELLYAIHNPF